MFPNLENESSRRGGFALISSLLVLVVLSVLGLGSMFLTQMNLKIAENSRSSAVARFNAEAGLDSAFVIVAGAYRQTGAVPATIEDFRSAYSNFETSSYAFAENDGYTVFPDGTVRIRVVGFGPRNARHAVEALVSPEIQPIPGSSQGTVFGEGFVSKESITLNGNGTYDINFWSGSSIDIHPGKLMAGRVARAAGSVCRTGGNGTCYVDQPPPDVPMPVFDTLRSDVIAIAERDFPGFTMETCNTRSGAFSGSNQVVCVPPGGSLTITGAVSNLIVIGDTSTTVTIDARTGSPTDDDTAGVSIVSSAINFGANAEFHGTNSIVARANLTFGQNVISHDEIARTFIVTEGDFTLNGTGATDMFATFWVGGRFTVNGTPDRFRGSVVANSTIIRNGGGSFHTISDPEGTEHELIPDDPLPEFTAAGVRIISRR